MYYQKFEEIPVWQESRIFLRKIHGPIRNNQKLRRDFYLADQLRRASCSIMFNIAEGSERSSNSEFANFLNIAKGSAGEVRTITMLYITKDDNCINNKEFDEFKSEIEILSCHIANFRKFLLKKNRNRKK